MQKNNIRNFVCSFIFSILAVGFVQKVFWHAPIDKTEPVSKDELSAQNIPLFADKKSELVDFEGAFKKETIDVSEMAALVAPEPQNEDKQPLSLEKDTPIAHLETKDEPLQKIPTDLASATEILLDDEEIAEIREMKDHEASGIVYAQEDSVQTMEEPLVVASSNTDEEIPLTQNTEALYQSISINDEQSFSKIAMLEPNTLISTISEPDILEEPKTIAEADIKKSELADMLEISANSSNVPEVDESAWDVAETSLSSANTEQTETSDNPWVMAKGNKYAKNQAVVEEFNKIETEQKQTETVDEKIDQELSALKTKTDEQLLAKTFSEPLLKKRDNDTQLAYQAIQNILIPLPKDIMDDADLTPDLTSSPKERNIEEDLNKIRLTKQTTEIQEEDKKTGLFKSIRSWFSKDSSSQQEEQDQKTNERNKQKNKKKKINANSLKNRIFAVMGTDGTDDFDAATTIMPAELRLFFQPNRAEISGQTLRWIYAFADNARDNDDVYVEVRIDGTSSQVLQQKRLNLLSSIFSLRGVDHRKINVIFTSRDPNSFIIRNIRFNKNKRDDSNNQVDSRYRYQ